MWAVDQLSVELQQLRREKRAAKLRLREIEEKMRARKARQSEMVSREIDALAELDQAEAVASEVPVPEAPVMVPVAEDLYFDFLGSDLRGFDDCSWERSLAGLVAGDNEPIVLNPKSS